MIKYEDLQMAFDFVNSGHYGEHLAYLNRHTGQTYWQSEYADDLDELDELPEDIDDGTIYVEIPHKNDLNLGKKLVLKFAYTHLPEDIERVEAIFRKKGAYAKFKSLLERKGMIDQWYDYEAKAQKTVLKQWCELNDITINDE